MEAICKVNIEVDFVCEVPSIKIKDIPDDIFRELTSYARHEVIQGNYTMTIKEIEEI
jgi:hypothetical protein